MLLRTTSRSLVPLALSALVVPLLTASAPAAGPWLPSVKLGTISRYNGSGALGMDSAGNAVVIWNGDGGDYVARRPAGGEWSAPTRVDGGLAYPSGVALRDDGTVVVSVSEGGDYQDYRGLAVLTPDNAVIDGSREQADASYGAVDQHDQGLLGVVLSHDPDATRLSYAAGGDEPGTWRSTYVPPGPVEDVTVAMSKGDTYFVALRPNRNRGAYDRIQLRSVDGLTGAATSLYDQQPSGTIRYYDVGSDSHGNAVVAWVAKVGAKFALKAVRVRPDGHVGPTVTVARRTTGPSARMSPPQVVMGPGGLAQVVWSEPLTSARRRLVVASSVSGNSWGARKVLDGSVAATSWELMRLSVTAVDDGAVLMSYHDGESHSSVYRAPGSAYDAPRAVFARYSNGDPGLQELQGVSLTGDAAVLNLHFGDVRARSHR